MQNFQAPRGWGIRPQTPETAPQLQISTYTPGFNGNTFITGAEGLIFKSRLRQIERNVANCSPLLRHLFAERRELR